MKYFVKKITIIIIMKISCCFFSAEMNDEIFEKDLTKNGHTEFQSKHLFIILYIVC